MKPFLLLSMVSLVFMPIRLLAQSTAAEAALERKANEERLARLNATVVTLSETLELLRSRNTELDQRVTSLNREINKLKEESVLANSRGITREEFNSLVEKLKEIERKREDDRKLILESIKDLAKLPVSTPTHSKPSVEHQTEVGETVDYTVKKGELLFQIIAAYNDEFAKQGRGRITEEQVKKANSDLNPNKIREKQVIRIPVPPKK